MSTKKKTFKGVVWSGIERFSVQIIQFIVSIILARLLTPSDFGVVAIVLVLINILQVFNEVGFGAALMQKLDRDELDYSTVFFFNIIWGGVLYLLLYLIAPYFSLFFKIEELTHLTRLLGLNLIFASFVVVQRTRLIIQIDFKTQAKASFVAVIISGSVGVYSAYIGMGVISIVIQHLLFTLTNTLFIWILAKWRPKLQFSFKRLKSLFNYAYKLIIARFINAVFQEIYSFAIGKAYTPAQLGYFNRAKSFTSISSNNITSIVQRVSTPVLCEAQVDYEKMGNLLLGFIQKTSFIVFPLLCGLFVLSDSLIIVLLTEKWLPASWILKVLCPVGMLFVFSTFNMNVFNATGRTDWAMISEIIKKTLNILILIGALFIGFEALIISQIFVALIDFFIDTWFTKKQIGLTVVKQLSSVIGILVASLLMIGVVIFITSALNKDIWILSIGVVGGALFYLSICYIFNIAEFKKIVIQSWEKIKIKQ